MIHLLIMNVMGSLFYALHGFFYCLEQKFILPTYRLFIHRLNLLFFIIPFPAILFYARRYLDSFVSRIPIGSFYLNGAHIIVHLSQNISFALPKLYYVIVVLFIIIWIGAMIKPSKYVSNEHQKIRRIDSYFYVFGEEEMAQSSIDVNRLLDAALKEMNMKKRPRIYIHQKVTMPHTIGVLKPAIYLPSNWDVSEQVYYLTIKHELAHIKHKDLMFEYVMQIIGIVHWFNPLLDRIYSNIKTCEELAADACACEGASPEDCKAYQTAILNLSDTDTSAPDRRVRGLIYKIKLKDNTKERILTMKNKNLNKHKGLKLAATALMSAVIFTVSVIPALAYTLPSTVETEGPTVDSLNMLDITVISPESRHISGLNSSKTDLYNFFKNLDFSDTDFICIDDNGIMYDASVEPYIISCNHNYLAAQASHHQKNSDGSCKVTYYNAKRCSKCGHIVIVDEDGYITYNKCPH